MRKLLVAVLLLTAGVAQAEYLGLPNGRTPDMSRLPDLSVEAGLVTGNLELADYLGTAARVNYRVNPGLFAFADLGLTEIGNTDGFAVGGGVFYNLGDFLENFDSAAKASFHTGDFDGFDLNVMSLELIIGGFDSYIDTGIHWYANAGLHWLDAGDSELEIGIGIGLVYPMETGEVFAGLDMVDELTVALGYRHYLE